MEYYNSLLTERSWRILVELAGGPLGFTVIGGWAAYLWTHAQKSRDVDIVLDSVGDLEQLKKESPRKNESLRKYELRYGEIDVDVYVPYYSRLAIPPEDVSAHTARVQGFKVASPEALCILKQGAEEARSHSVKGLKDRVDIMTLLLDTGFDYTEYKTLALKYGHTNYPTRLRQMVNTFRDGDYLNLNPRQLKLKKKEVLGKLK